MDVQRNSREAQGSEVVGRLQTFATRLRIESAGGAQAPATRVEEVGNPDFLGSVLGHQEGTCDDPPR